MEDYAFEFDLTGITVSSVFTPQSRFLIATPNSVAIGASDLSAQTFDLSTPVYLIGEADSSSITVSSTYTLDGVSLLREEVLALPNLIPGVAPMFNYYLSANYLPDEDGTERIMVQAGGIGAVDLLNTDPIMSGYHEFTLQDPFTVAASLSPTGEEIAGVLTALSLQVFNSPERTISLVGREPIVYRQSADLLVIGAYFRPITGSELLRRRVGRRLKRKFLS
ncbi:MAG: hypothetical protein AAGN35_08370 [Bacteroidota bacterium]